MEQTQVSPAKPTPRPRNTALAPFTIGDKVTITDNTEDAMFLAGQHGVVEDVEYDPDDSWGPWIIRVRVLLTGTVFAFKPSELRRRAS